MTTITKTITKTVKTVYHCECCNFDTKNKTDFNKHLETSKHINKSKNNEKEINNDMENIISDLRRQLEEQKDKYDYLKEELTEEFRDKFEEQKEVFEEKLSNQKEKYEDKLIEKEKEIERQQETINKLIDRPQAINPVYPSVMSLPEKTVFNRDTFLNEDCKDAMNVDEFAKLLNVEEDDFKSFLTLEKVSFTDLATTIIKRILKQVGKFKRPVHFTDVSRNVKYAKNSENKWVLVDETQEVFKNWTSRINLQVTNLLLENSKKIRALNNRSLDSIQVKAQLKHFSSPDYLTIRNDVINSLGKSCFIKD